MNRRVLRLLLAFAFLMPQLLTAQRPGWGGQLLVPDTTVQFAQRDTLALYMDVYSPSEGSDTYFNGQEKPTVMFVFGGGFQHGSRRDMRNVAYYKALCDNGYRVIAIDYRLGLKGYKAGGAKYIAHLNKAIRMAVEDAFSATAYVLEHADELGTGGSGIVIAGSSAGAVTALQAEWELCNGHRIASVLPEGFNYVGVMAFSGAIFSKEGTIRYRKLDPCPHFMCHGTADDIVPYNKIRFLNLNFAGTSTVAKTFARNDGYCYTVLRFQDRKHEVAGFMTNLMPREIEFLENSIMSHPESPVRVDSIEN